MTIAANLTKPIVEVRYLTAENCYRYRPILRFFYHQYEKINLSILTQGTGGRY